MSSSKVVDLVSALNPSQRFFSLEFFPPKTKAGLENLEARVQRMLKLNPLFVTVTWGAGGSTAEKSLNLAAHFQSKLGVPTVLHLTCTNMQVTLLDKTLAEAKRCGIRNILALRGDPPREYEYDVSGCSKDFQYAVDLVKYIRNKYGDFFCIGVAAYPEGHAEGVDSQNQDYRNDLPYLVEKVKAGADFVMTQLCYDENKFLEFEQSYSADPVLSKIPLVPGLMPLNTYQGFIRSAKLSHASIPNAVREKLESLKLSDDEEIKSFGVELISSIIESIHEKSAGRIRGFHFYTLNLEKSVARILEATNLWSDTATNDTDKSSSAQSKESSTRKARKSSAGAHNRLIIDRAELLASATKSTDFEDVIVEDDSLTFAPNKKLISVKEDAFKRSGSPTTDTALAISTGEGALGREATWDDFPNGRFGDSRSPAFGEYSGYGPQLHIESNAEGLAKWGYPVEDKDITKLFVRKITGQLDIQPWSFEPLSAETALIQEQLMNLNAASYWTVASQPAANGVSSTDKIFGWGPPRGYVFQKAFVEFFVSPQKWTKLKAVLDDKKLNGIVTYFSGNTSSPEIVSSSGPNASNVVTWGVFPNREVTQSTIISVDSFAAWRDEAFSIWKEWRALYKPNTATSNLLENIYNTYELVTVIHHDYCAEDALWELLSNA